MLKLKPLFALFTLVYLSTFAVESLAADGPNVIVILADDK